MFFRETYDCNRDGRRNDGLTDVGVVERVRGRHRGVCRPRQPRRAPRGGRISSTRGAPGRERRSGQRSPTRVLGDGCRSAADLTGELFAGYARVAVALLDGLVPASGPPLSASQRAGAPCGQGAHSAPNAPGRDHRALRQLTRQRPEGNAMGTFSPRRFLVRGLLVSAALRRCRFRRQSQLRDR